MTTPMVDGGAASLLQHNRDQDFPDGTGRDLTGRSLGTRLLLLATDGATSGTLRTSNFHAWIGSASSPTLAP